MIRTLFQSQIDKNMILTKEMLDTMPNQYYQNGKPKQIGDVCLYAFIKTEENVTFRQISLDEIGGYSYDESEYQRMLQCPKDLTFTPILKY